MSDQEHVCARCSRPMRHDTALIDTPCANLLRRHLEDVAKIAGDINLTVARLDRVARGGGPTEDLGWWKAPNALEAIPLPVDLDKACRHDAAALELSTWARLIWDQRGSSSYTIYADHHLHPLAVLARFLMSQVEWLRHQPFADEAWPALLAACAELVRVVDTRPPGDMVGLCQCGTALYAEGPELRCPRCHTISDLATTRAQLDAAMHEALVSASEAATWVAHMGLVTDTGKLRKLIWAWADRGHLTAVDDVPRYRFGDVLQRVMQSPALRAA